MRMNRSKGVRTGFVFVLSAVLVLFAASFTWALNPKYWDSADVPSLSVPTATVGTTYYVDASRPDDTGNGLTLQTAYKTIHTAIHNKSFSPGDHVLIKAGFYREDSAGYAIYVRAKGTQANPVVIGPYGDGEVIIDRSAPTTWAVYSGTTFKTHLAFIPLAMVYKEVPLKLISNGTGGTGKDDLLDGYYYWDSVNSDLYARFPAGTTSISPTDVIVLNNINSDPQKFIAIEDTTWVTFYGLTVRGGGGHGFEQGTYSPVGVKVERCNVKFNGKGGIVLGGPDFEISKNNVYHNIQSDWPRGRLGGGGWSSGISTGSAWIHGNIVHKNGGEGIVSYTGTGGSIIEDNISYDNFSVNIYNDNQPNTIIRRNMIYSNEPIVSDLLYPNLDISISKRLRPHGIMTADENYGLTPPANFNNAKIYNNIIINCRYGYQHYGAATGSGVKNLLFANNIIIVPPNSDSNAPSVGITMTNNNGNNIGSRFYNNIVYSSNANAAVLYVPDTSLSGITFANNLWYHSSSSSPFNWLGTNYNYSGWKAQSGQDSGGIYSTPLFVGGSDVFLDAYYNPTLTSPAVGAAVALADFNTDFNGFARPTSWTVGALEYGSEFDSTPPIVTSFTMPTTATSQTVSINSFTASDNVGVTGYLVTESNTVPAAGAAGWAASAQTSYTFSTAGYKTAYAWAKDAAGNVSNSLSASVTITPSDATAPTVTAFTIPTTSTSLTVPISNLTATDNVGVTGYLVMEGSTPPSVSATGWSATAPTTFTFSGDGSKTAYAWAKDAAGNMSNGLGRTVTITLPDTTAPVVSVFTIPATATSLTVPISNLTATDIVGVTGYLITESATKPAASAAGWSATVPASFVFSGYGSKTAYAWARDAAGNVSLSRSASVNITLADTTAPVVSSFGMPATATSLTISVSNLTATDAVGVTGYLITESPTKPAASASGWTASVPTNFTFSAVGSKTAYAWARDAAGNVSASRSATVSITLAAETPVLTISDALMALQTAAGMVQPASAQKTRLDVAPYINGKSQPDGIIDVGDAIVILGKVTGKIAL